MAYDLQLGQSSRYVSGQYAYLLVSGDTVYYGNDVSVSASYNLGSLTPGQYLDQPGPAYLVSAGTSYIRQVDRATVSDASIVRPLDGGVPTYDAAERTFRFKAGPPLHAATHLPGGTDALTTDTPVSVGAANSEGTAASFARSDHVHKLDAPGCRVYRATDQTGIVTATWTAVSFSNERYDPDNMWTSGANITIPKTGVYSLWANIKWDTNTTGSRYAYISGSTAGVVALIHVTRASSESQVISSISKLTAGEVVAMYVWQDSGADRSLLSGQPTPEFAVQYVGAG